MTKRANDLGAEGRRCGRCLGSRQSCLSLLVSSLYILDRIPEYVVRRNQYPVTHLTKFCCLTRSVCAKRLPLSMFETICFNASGTFLIPISSACEDLSPRLPALFISLASGNFELQNTIGSLRIGHTLNDPRIQEVESKLITSTSVDVQRTVSIKVSDTFDLSSMNLFQ